jgi:membrane dipeptidase
VKRFGHSIKGKELGRFAVKAARQTARPTTFINKTNGFLPELPNVFAEFFVMKRPAFLAFVWGLAVLAGPVPAQVPPDDALRQRADEIAHRYVLTDGHVDLPYRLRVKHFRLEREYLGIPLKSAEGDFDYERARRGGLSAPFMSVYIPASYQETGGAKELADTLIHLIDGICRAHPRQFARANSPDEVLANFKRGVISLPMGMENGAPIGSDLRNVQYFFDRGIRYITLTHGKDNLLGDSSYDTTRTWGGLSPFGREVVREMNRVGMMIDVSHISDETFYQVMEHTQVPCIASHSSCRAFTPGFRRNMSDDMIRRLAQNGGVIQINFSTPFLDEKMRLHAQEKQKEFLAELTRRGLKSGTPEAEAFEKAFLRDNPMLFADVERVADHIDHVVKLVGIDYVGFGSDFDGVGDTLPTGLKDVSQYPNLLYVLLKRGYSEADLAKICSGNVFRVWRQVLAKAGK